MHFSNDYQKGFTAGLYDGAYNREPANYSEISNDFFAGYIKGFRKGIEDEKLDDGLKESILEARIEKLREYQFPSKD